MLFIDDQQTKIFKPDLVLDQRMGANDDIDVTGIEGRNDLILSFAGFKPRDAFDSDRPVGKAVSKGLQMLFG